MMGFTCGTGGAVVTTGAEVVGATGAVVGVLLEQLARMNDDAKIRIRLIPMIARNDLLLFIFPPQ